MKEKLKNIKGITLIALIITIIVMIILVAVSVTVALQGGLFTAAKTATSKTQLERDKELLTAAAVGALGEDGKLVYENIQLPEEFEKTSDGVYTKDGYTFLVDEYGTVTIGEGQIGGDEIDFEAIIAAVEANPQEYLARAQATGQNIASNTDIGIGTDGEIVNLDLWTYTAENNAITLTGGMYSAGYKGQIIDGKIQGSVPQYIYTNNVMLTVTTIGEYAFQSLRGLTDISIPDTVTVIRNRAFYENSSLTTIIIPDNVISIGDYVFAGNSLLRTITIGRGVNSIGDNTFINCSSLTEINIDNTANAISGKPWGATNATVTWLR